MRIYIYIIILFLSQFHMRSQVLSNENFIYTETPQKAVKSAAYTSLPASEKQKSVTYFDGLGRPMQTIAIGQGGSGEDIITPITYDGFGRQDKDYLPYTAASTGLYRMDAFVGVSNFYKSYENTLNPYSEKQFEASPLNRVVQQAAPGNAWSISSNHTIKMDYQTNGATEVKLFQVTTVWNTPIAGLYNPTISQSTTYGVGQLYKTITKDENWIPGDSINKTTEEFKDKEGRLVLKRTYNNSIAHDTYYVYDAYGNLTYVIPPLANGAFDATTLNNLCYQYKYDYRNLLVEKKLPGKDWEYIVYDKLGRVVATGPAFSPFSDLTTVGWLITKYDAFSRPVYTGWMTATATTSAGRKTLQDEQNIATVLYESKQASGTIDGIAAYYTNAIAPTLFKLLTVNYYDNYTFPNVPSIPSTVETQTVLTTTQVKSLATGSWTRALTTSAAILGETATTFYDVKGRAIRSHNQNYLDGYTYADSKLDFTGVPQYSITYHKRLSTDTELKITEAFTYSTQGRLLTHTHQINAGVAQLLTSNTYDELGQLISKKVGNTAAAPIQKVDYTYNIRGWLTDINNVSALQQGADPKDLFAFRINYNTSTTGITGVKPLYNGDIAETFWNTASDPLAPIRAYGYQYDNLNRLENAVYKKDGTITNSYNEGITYDKNGNILTLLRNGNSDVTATAIDNLAYTYTTTSNQLVKVTDTSNNSSSFKDGTNSDNDFTYDTNGNMVTDKNKNITAIVYNHLNLPTKITSSGGFTFGSIQYIYNARGQKLEKNVSQGTATLRGTNISVTNYLDGFQYLKAYNTYNTPKGGYFLMKFFPTAEGYVEPSGSSYKYVYQYKDHLGNVRLSYDNTLTIQEENNYYPFGLKQIGYNGLAPSTSQALKYKYNGKELQDELGLNWYDYGARNYDPALGRWLSPDALSEEFPDYSPYVYAFNDPIRHTDPDGNAPADVVILGANNSSITLKTNLIDIKVNASSLGVDFGGNYSLSGNDVLSAGLDIVGIFDPTGISDAAGAKLAYESGDYLSAGISALGVVPFGDVAKVGKIGKDIKIIDNAIGALKSSDNAKALLKEGRSGKAEKLRDLATDTKLGKSDKGWIKQEMNQIDRGKRTNIRNPPGKDLAHERGREAAKGYSYKHSNLQNRADHRRQHKYDNNGKANKERKID